MQGLGPVLTLVLAVVLTPTDAAGAERASADAVRQIRELIEQSKLDDAESTGRALLAEAEAEHGADSLATADVLDMLVEVLRRQGRATEEDTLALAERSLETKVAILGDDHGDLAASFRNLGAIYRDRGEFETARGFFEEALTIAEAAHGTDHLGVADHLSMLANLLGRMGDRAAARPLLERSLAIREAALGPDHPDVARAINNLAVLVAQSGDYRGALPLFERTVVGMELAYGPDHPAVAPALTNLARLSMMMGDYRAAVPLVERAVVILETRHGVARPEVATSLGVLSSVHLELGEYVTARPLLERELAIWETTRGPEHPAVAGTLNNLASLFQETGDYAAARAAYERALAIREKAEGPDHPRVARVLNNLANLHARMGNDLEARALMERALAIREASLGAEHPRTATTLRNLARFLIEAGELDEARTMLERAVDIQESALGSTPDLAFSVFVLAELERRAGEVAEARRNYERALEIRLESLGFAHPLVARSFNGLAELLWASGEGAAALDAALQAELIGRDHLQATARGLSERQALRYLAVRVSGLDLALTAAIEAAQVERAWDALIRSRALVLDEMASRHRAVVTSEQSEIAGLFDELVSARHRLASLMVQDPGGNPERYRKLLDLAREDRETAERALATESATFRQAQARDRIGYAEVGSALPPGSALIAYVRYEQHASAGEKEEGERRPPTPAYMALVMAAMEASPAIVRLGPAERIDALIAQWKQEVATRPVALQASRRAAEADYHTAGEALRRVLWDPLVEHLGEATQVFIVPDGAINLVNVATLPTGDGFLVETGPPLHHLSAERDLVSGREEAVPGVGLLVVGGADFDANPADRGSSSVAQVIPRAEGQDVYRGPHAACTDFHSYDFAGLQASEDEIEEIAALWLQRRSEGDEASVLTLAGPDATETAVKHSVPGRQVVHLATHGFFLQESCASSLGRSRGPEPGADRPVTGDNPLLLTGLALAGANRRNDAGEGEEDGILTAEEIASLDLRGVEWVVLSACETGLGQVLEGEGVLGLRRAFETAGVGTLIMSLWSVQDEATRAWMKELYDARLHGRTTVEAVRQASLGILQARREANLTDHPFFWGAFVAAGDWQ